MAVVDWTSPDPEAFGVQTFREALTPNFLGVPPQSVQESKLEKLAPGRGRTKFFETREYLEALLLTTGQIRFALLSSPPIRTSL